MFLVNSRQRDFRCGLPCGRQALSLTYGRFFAEFLKDDSPVPLGLLALSTSVGLRYGDHIVALPSFSRKALQLSLCGKTAHSRSLALTSGTDAKPLRHLILFPLSFGYDYAAGQDY